MPSGPVRETGTGGKAVGGGGGLHHPFRGHIEWKFISHFTKNNLANEVHYESQFNSERVYFTRKKAESPNTLYHALALRHVRINKLF